MTYSYDPDKICDYGKDQMRFELGDTAVAQGELGCALSDEEYFSILEGISSGKRGWMEGKLRIVRGMLHKFAFQVDTKIDVLTYDFSSRVGHWERICKELEKELDGFAVPVLTGGKHPPYFQPEMMGNQGKSPISRRNSSFWKGCP